MTPWQIALSLGAGTSNLTEVPLRAGLDVHPRPVPRKFMQNRENSSWVIE